MKFDWIKKIIEVCEKRNKSISNILEKNFKVLKSFTITEATLITLMELFPIKVNKVIENIDGKPFCIGTYKKDTLLSVVGSFDEGFDMKFTLEYPDIIEQLLLKNKEIPTIDNHPLQ